MEPGDQETKSLSRALNQPDAPLISGDPDSANGTLRKLLKLNTQLSQEAREREQRGEDLVRLTGQIVVHLLMDPKTRRHAADMLQLKRHFWRYLCHGDTGQSEVTVEHAQVLGPFARYFPQIYLKAGRHESGTESRLDFEDRRIRHFVAFNQFARKALGIDEDYMPVPDVLCSATGNGVTILAERKINGICSYQEQSELERKMLDEDKRSASGEADPYFRFWENNIARITKAQAASLSLSLELVDLVHLESHPRKDGKYELEAQENAKFFIRQLKQRFVGDGKHDDQGFPGTLAVLFAGTKEERAMTSELHKLLDTVYFPVAYLLGRAKPGIDCDRSLWNIMPVMVDFETVTNSPHPIALANATAQSLPHFNRKYRNPHPLTVCGEVIARRGEHVPLNTFFKAWYVEGFNSEVTRLHNAGLLGKDPDPLSNYLITDYDTFRRQHSLAGIQRSLAHTPNLIRRMHHAEIDGDGSWYKMASKGLQMAFAHARENLKATIDYLKQDRTLEQAPFGYNATQVRSTLAGLTRLNELFGEVRDYIKDNKRLMRERVVKPWYDSPSH